MARRNSKPNPYAAEVRCDAGDLHAHSLQVGCEHDSPAYRGRSAARWVPVSDGLTHKLTDLRSWLLNCRSSLAGASSSS